MTSAPHTVVTGASSGIGAAIARQLSARGHRLSLGARRAERLDALGDPTALRHPLDVTDEASVEAFLAAARAAHGPIDVLVNNAGLARGIETIAGADGIAWREMIETNVLGVLHVTRRVVPEMIERGTGHVVMIGSVAGHETYEGGSVYCGTKRALRSIAEGLRYETLGTGVRVTSVDPGMVETEFSLVRFRGDSAKADAVYRDTRPLTADDVADCVTFALSRPPHVNIDAILVMPTDQASPKRVHRRSP
ncbi:MAG: SDR family NAD(P)-dependent oxidoreductase [Planctomycetes bacterium]|nr:SDR family NAD(P)-dependent oxidoreductase [Planctomycetota bacterium]